MTSEKRPLVYVCTDSSDTQLELYTLNRAILQLGGLPVQMCFIEGSGEYDWPLVRATIDAADIFVLLVGASYGAISESGESYIHKEAVYAKSKNKHVVALLKNTELKSLSSQSVQRLRSLHRLMMTGVFKYWNAKEELMLIARQVLRHLLKPQLGLSVVSMTQNIEPILNDVVTDTLFELSSYPIRFSGKVFAHGNCSDVQLKLELSWDTAFINVASVMTAPVTEDKMRSVLEDYVSEYHRDQFMAKVVDSHALGDVRCNEIEFQRLKAYLKGAGVIENVSNSGSGLRNYWQLTPRGENKLRGMLIPN